MCQNSLEQLSGLKIGIAITGSFCTYEKLFQQLTRLSEANVQLYPIISYNASHISSRFGTSEEHKKKIAAICNRPIVETIAGAEPFGPKIHLDAMVILPCTGNTISKLAHAITDTPVLMAAKAHLRNGRPLILSLSSNDALGLNFANIGLLMNAKNIYFVPFGQDDFAKKPNSMIAHVEQLPETILQAIQGKQLQPVIVSPFKLSHPAK